MHNVPTTRTAVLILAQAPRPRWNGRQRALAWAVVAAIALAAVAIAGHFVADAAAVTDFTRKSQPPSVSHPFGTDWMGRDLWLRTVAGLSTSIVVGLVAASMSAVVASVLAVLAALGPRWMDAAIGWLVDLMLGIPHLLLLLLVSIALGGGVQGITIGVAVTHWPTLTRVLRGEILQLRGAVYIGAARRLGHSWAQIAWRHMRPAIVPQFVVGFVLLFPHAVLHEAAITFLGFGLPPETAAIGIVLSESMGYLSAGLWWSAVFPGLALVGIVLLFDTLGSTVRRLFDPARVQE